MFYYQPPSFYLKDKAFCIKTKNLGQLEELNVSLMGNNLASSLSAKCKWVVVIPDSYQCLLYTK
jgi:hypothetical protein